MLALPDGRIYVNKTTTTPADPGEGVVAGIAAVLAEARLDPREVAEVVHGTTVASNTILQKVGARTGLLTTRGFRDVLEIGRIRTPGMFDLAWEQAGAAGRPRRWRLEVGGAHRVPTAASSRRWMRRRFARRQRPSSPRAWRPSPSASSIPTPTDAHERRRRALCWRELPRRSLVTASCEVLPEIKEYERTSTAVVNAYLLPAMRGYLAKLAERPCARIGVDRAGAGDGLQRRR